MASHPLPASVPRCQCPGSTTLDVRLSRRSWLRGAALTGATVAFGSTAVTVAGPPSPAVAETAADSVIVLLSLRGAADGLSLVVPHAETAYYQARPGIAVPAAALLARDDTFGLHPALAPLMPLWNAGRLAAIQATGLPVANRSHFSAMEEIEEAAPDSAVRVGWLNRLISVNDSDARLEGIAVGDGVPASFYGPHPVMSFRTLETATVAGSADPQQRRLRSLDAMWRSSTNPLAEAARTALDAVDDLAAAKAQPDHVASYPSSDLGRALSSVARTLRADLGVTTVTVDSSGWDMHVGLGRPVPGSWMYRSAADLASSIAAFFADLGEAAGRVTLVTISEFGRRVQENSTAGLDHGWGNVMFAVGAGVKGGRYYGRWPGLQNSVDADLTVTTDFRSVLSEIVTARTSISTAAVFPGFSPEPLGFMTRL